MARPREHDEETRAALHAAAERIVAESGPDALSVRAVADEADTTTRAVYTLFGSKDGLVATLAQHAFGLLVARAGAVRETRDPAADLVRTGVNGFRPFVLEHPSLYRIAFQRVVPGLREVPELTAARGRALKLLQSRVHRVKDAGGIPRKSVAEASVEFNAMCEGLANAELRGTTLPILPAGHEERAWTAALRSVVRGWAA